MNTCRCSVCGRTNSPHVDSHQYTPGPFFDDKKGRYKWDKICEDCLSNINETNQPFEDEEEYLDVYTS